MITLHNEEFVIKLPDEGLCIKLHNEEFCDKDCIVRNRVIRGLHRILFW